MANFFEKIKDVMGLGRTKSRIRTGEPVTLTTGSHLMNQMLLPDSFVISSGYLPILDNIAYYPFYRPFFRPSPYHIDRAISGAEYYGVAAINLNEKLETAYHILPVFPPEIQYGTDSLRFFNFQTVSGSSLIFSLREPFMPEKKGYDNFLYSFDTEKRYWYRITSADKDGNYEKVMMDSRVYPDFPTESSDNVFKTFDGKLIVWGREDDRLNIVEDDTYDDTHSDFIAESGPEVVQALEERGAYNRRYCKRGLVGSLSSRHLSIENYDFIPLFIIPDIHDYFAGINIASPDICIGVSGVFPIRYLSGNCLAIFFSYFMPKKWEKGLMMIFKCEGGKTDYLWEI